MCLWVLFCPPASRGRRRSQAPQDQWLASHIVGKSESPGGWVLVEPVKDRHLGRDEVQRWGAESALLLKEAFGKIQIGWKTNRWAQDGWGSFEEVLGRGIWSRDDSWDSNPALWPGSYAAKESDPFVLQFLEQQHGDNSTCCYPRSPVQSKSTFIKSLEQCMACCNNLGTHWCSTHFQVLNTLKRQSRVFPGVWLTSFLHLHKVMRQDLLSLGICPTIRKNMFTGEGWKKKLGVESQQTLLNKVGMKGKTLSTFS